MVDFKELRAARVTYEEIVLEGGMARATVSRWLRGAKFEGPKQGRRA